MEATDYDVCDGAIVEVCRGPHMNSLLSVAQTLQAPLTAAGV